MPIWIPLSLLFPALTGIVNILDKLIVDRHAPRTYYYFFWIGIFELALGLIAFGIVSAQGPEPGAVLGGVLTGATSACALMLYLAALKRGQVARVVPVWYLYPLLVAPMAVVFLDEELSALAWAAVPLAVAGGLLVSWQGRTDGRAFGSPAVLLLALAAAVLLAVSFVLSKYFLEENDFWHFFASYRLGFGPAMLWVAFLPDVRRGALGLVNNRGFMGLVILAEAIITMALIARFAAVNLGPVTLVTAISSSQPAMVFFYALGLATIFPAYFRGWITRSTLRPQMMGIGAITAAVVIISFQ